MSWIDNAKDYMVRLWRDSHVGCVIVTTDGFVLDCNQCFARTLERTVTETDGKHVDELTDYEFRGTGAGELQRVIDGEVAYYEQKKKYLKKDGKPIWATTRSFLIERDDPHFFSVVVFDEGKETIERLESITKKLDLHDRLIEAIVGRSNKTTVISGNKEVGYESYTADRGGQNNRNDSKVILYVCVALVAVAVVMFGGKFVATNNGDQQTIEVNGDESSD